MRVNRGYARCKIAVVVRGWPLLAINARLIERRSRPMRDLDEIAIKWALERERAGRKEARRERDFPSCRVAASPHAPVRGTYFSISVPSICALGLVSAAGSISSVT